MAKRKQGTARQKIEIKDLKSTGAKGAQRTRATGGGCFQCSGHTCPEVCYDVSECAMHCADFIKE